MYYCVRNIVLEVTNTLMLKFITIFWGGGKPLPQTPISNENNENLKLFKTLMFKATRCIHAQKQCIYFRSK